jgi:hypothetical protein
MHDQPLQELVAQRSSLGWVKPEPDDYSIWSE